MTSFRHSNMQHMAGICGRPCITDVFNCAYLACRLMQCLSEAAIATLVPPDTAPADDVQQAVRRLTHRPGALQHHVLQYTSHLLSAMPSAIHFLRQTGLWEMAFGPAYFFLQVPLFS